MTAKAQKELNQIVRHGRRLLIGQFPIERKAKLSLWLDEITKWVKEEGKEGIT